MKKRVRILAALLSGMMLLGTATVSGAEDVETYDWYDYEEMGVMDESPQSVKSIDDLPLEEYLELHPEAAESEPGSVGLGDYIAQNPASVYSRPDGQTLSDFVASHAASEYTINDVTLEEHIALYGVSSAAVTNGWYQNSSGKWQYYEDGVPVAGEWRFIDGVWYYFDPDSYMVSGAWRQIDGIWYYLQTGGAMAKGWLKIGNYWYYFESDGAMQTGHVEMNGSEYYFREDDPSASNYGSMYQGLYPSANKPNFYYGNPNNPDAGAKYKGGWLHLGNDWYYAHTTYGNLYVDFQEILNTTSDGRTEKWRYFFDLTSRKMTVGSFEYYNDNDEPKTAHTITDPNSSHYGAIIEATYNVVANDLGESNYAEVDKNIASLEDSGYYTSSTKCKSSTDSISPKELFDDLPTRKVAIIHGHGSYVGQGDIGPTLGNRFIEFCNGKINNPKYGNLWYNYNGTLKDTEADIKEYEGNALSYVDLVWYTSCYTASVGTDSIAYATYDKGAETVIGYRNTVSYGEWYTAFAMESLEDGYTLAEALIYADSEYDALHSNVSETSSAASDENRTIYGNSMLTILMEE